MSLVVLRDFNDEGSQGPDGSVDVIGRSSDTRSHMSQATAAAQLMKRAEKIANGAEKQ